MFDMPVRPLARQQPFYFWPNLLPGLLFQPPPPGVQMLFNPVRRVAQRLWPPQPEPNRMSYILIPEMPKGTRMFDMPPRGYERMTWRKPWTVQNQKPLHAFAGLPGTRPSANWPPSMVVILPPDFETPVVLPPDSVDVTLLQPDLPSETVLLPENLGEGFQ